MSDETEKKKKRETARTIAAYVRALLGRTANPRLEDLLSTEDMYFLRNMFSAEWTAWDTTTLGSVSEADAVQALLKVLEACTDEPAAPIPHVFEVGDRVAGPEVEGVIIAIDPGSLFVQGATCRLWQSAAKCTLISPRGTANSSEVTQSLLAWTARVIELARKAQQARVDCVVTDVEYDATFAEYERARLKRAETFRARYELEKELKTATTAAAILEAAKEEKNA